MSIDTAPLEPDPRAPRPRRRRWWYLAGGVLLVAVVVVAAVLLRGDGAPDAGVPAADPTADPTAAPTGPATPTATPSPTGPGADVDRSTAVWPWSGSDVSYDDPVEAARGFAVDFLGFRSPTVGAFRQGDSRSGEVDVQPTATGPATTVLVRQLSGEDGWSVLGATTAEVRLDEPAALSAIGSPVTLRGEARAFEGTVQVEVRQDGSREPIGEGFVTGGGDAMRPFQGDVAFRTPSAAAGAVVLLTESAEDGSVWSATVVRVSFGSATGEAP